MNAKSVVTDELWEKWAAMEKETVEIEVDERGERWVELVDATGKRLSVVRREEEVGLEFTLWRRKDVVEGGLKGIPVSAYEGPLAPLALKHPLCPTTI
jgi:hypothetical protein